jgi:hypothetical protein
MDVKERKVKEQSKQPKDSKKQLVSARFHLRTTGGTQILTLFSEYQIQQKRQ